MATFFHEHTPGEHLAAIDIQLRPWESNSYVTVTTIHRYLGNGYMHDVHTDVVFFICDDCREAYPGPVYYAFDPDGCGDELSDQEWEPHRGCTGNLCPPCAGPHVDPDKENDPRRPHA